MRELKLMRTIVREATSTIGVKPIHETVEHDNAVHIAISDKEAIFTPQAKNKMSPWRRAKKNSMVRKRARRKKRVMSKGSVTIKTVIPPQASPSCHRFWRESPK